MIFTMYLELFDVIYTSTNYLHALDKLQNNSELFSSFIRKRIISYSNKLADFIEKSRNMIKPNEHGVLL